MKLLEKFWGTFLKKLMYMSWNFEKKNEKVLLNNLAMLTACYGNR